MTTLVTSYINPDLDGVACIVAYTEFLESQGQDAVGMIMGKMQDEAAYVFKRFGWLSLPVVDDPARYENVALVDVSFLEGLGGRIPLDRVVAVIDHHFANDDAEFPHATLQIEKIGAAATMVAERFIQMKVPISDKAALLLASAIIVQTINMQGAVTTDRDRTAYRWLVERSGKPADFWVSYWKSLFEVKSDVAGDLLYEKTAADLATLKVGDITLGFGQLEILGVRDLLRARIADIKETLRRIMKDENLNSICLSLIELEDGSTVLVAFDPEMKALLEKACGIRFERDVVMESQNTSKLGRKQIMAPVQALLEKG